MAAWVIQAIAAAARIAGRGAVGTPIRAGLTGLGIGGAVSQFGIPGVDLFPDDKPKRRRRRRALTASDRADIAFIQATLGQAAGKSFAMLVVSRTTA